MSRAGLVDLSHAVEDGMITYRGLPAPVVCDWLSHVDSRGAYAAGTEFQIGEVRMVGNSGTYIDAPFHRFPDGPDVADLPLEAVAELDGVRVRAPEARRGGGRAVDADLFRGVEVEGRAVLVETGWSRLWGTDAYFEGHPFLTADAAETLRDRGVALVGIDSLNIDDTDDGRRPVHTTLLGAGIPVVEHLRGLEVLPDRGFTFHAVPVRVRGMGSFPVRAWARTG